MLQKPKTFTHSLPLAKETVTLIAVDENGEVFFANTRDQKMDALLDHAGYEFYAAWPGIIQTHLFVVNRREALKLLAQAR